MKTARTTSHRKGKAAAKTIISILLQGVTTVLAADFASGFVHWAEDAYARHDTPVIAAAWSMHWLTWQVWLFVLIAINANQIHKWAHCNPRENGLLVTFLQKIHLLQTQRHHARHHSGLKDSHYCPVTNVLNPVLDQLRVWKTFERINEVVFGLKRRPDPTVKLAL